MWVRGQGPPDAEIFIIGEAPGEREDACGLPFVGKSGDELTRYLAWIGLDRRKVYITNLVKLRPKGNADPTLAEVTRDEGHLRKELHHISPKYVITLGRFSTWWMLGRKLDERGRMVLPDMEMYQGIPRQVRVHGQEYVLLPIYHPAFGLHSAHMQRHIEVGWERLREVLEGRLAGPITRGWSPYDNPIYREFEDNAQDGWRFSAGPAAIAIDTEGTIETPWGLSFAAHGWGAHGYVVRANQPKCLARVAEYVQRDDITTVLHNAPHDLRVLAVMGVFPRHVEDTMQIAAALKLHPQALKTLSVRILDLDPEDAVEYPDIVRPAETKLALEYLLSAAERKWPDTKPEIRFTNGVAKIYQPQSIGKRILKILKDVKTKEEEVDPRARWMQIDPPLRRVVEQKLGPMPHPTLDDVARKVAVNYAAGDAHKTLGIYFPLRAEAKAMGLGRVLDMDHRTIPMFTRMMEVGMAVDTPYFRKLSRQYKSEMRELELEIKHLVGRHVNPGSSKQVAQLLFEDLKLPTIKLTKGKTGQSTDDKVLETLLVRTSHPVIQLLTQHREIDKLDSTYAATMPDEVDEETGRIHTKIKLTRTESGRPASADPNLLNIPTRTERGKEIRAGFVARTDDKWFHNRPTLLGSWDLNQVEMRILAHESEDDNLVRLFREGAECPVALASDEGKCKCHDIHLLTASKIYRIPIEEVNSEQRTLSKNVGFGIVYGLTAKGLRDQMAVRGQNWSEDECQDLIDAYLDRAYPGVRAYMQRMEQMALQDGFVRDMFGRVRYLAAVRSTDKRVKAEALRQAGNHPIQAGAAGIIKLAMVDLWENKLPKLWKRGYVVQPLLQIYDELLWQFEEGLEALLDPMIKRSFANAVDLKVPILSQGAWGERWSDLK